jgi:Protein of unknown function (DUF3054)
MRPFMSDTRWTPIADAVALLVFVAIGTTNHDRALTLGELASTAVPLLAAWFAAALGFGLYRRGGMRTLSLTWIVAVPAAVVLRSIWRGGPWDERLPIFTGVALAFTALFVLAARTLVAATTSRRQDPSPSEPRGRSSDVTS